MGQVPNVALQIFADGSDKLGGVYPRPRAEKERTPKALSSLSCKSGQTQLWRPFIWPAQ